MLKFVFIFALCFVQIFAQVSPKFSCDFTTIHGFQPEPIETSPYSIKISSYEYSPRTKITVSIEGQFFRGFYVRAFDTTTNEPIGSWEEILTSLPMDSCNAAMQADREDKESIELKWISPPQGRGKVYFKAMVMRDYSTFWTIILSDVNDVKQPNRIARSVYYY